MPTKVVLSVCALLLVTAVSAFPCSVTCVSGYYACCNTNPSHCYCFKSDGPLPPCDHGGAGASQCDSAKTVLDTSQTQTLNQFLSALAEDERLSPAQTEALSQFLGSLGHRAAQNAERPE
jgi:hypothetical protein